MQVDLGTEVEVTAVATQGRASSAELGRGSQHTVTSFQLLTSLDGMDWESAVPTKAGAEGVFQMGTNPDSTNFFVLVRVVRARYLRFMPVSWQVEFHQIYDYVKINNGIRGTLRFE
jgi:hypothetical protein